MKILQKDIDKTDGYFYGWDILEFKIGRFEFRWFTDCGEWFLYIEWDFGEEVKGYRFSSAGYLKIDYKKNTKE